MAKELILIVDDEKDVRDLVQYNLEKNGFKTSCAGTGEAAIAKAKAELPDLVVLDLMLPGVDGLDVCRVLKADTNTKGIPVIMLTAKGEEVDIVTGLELGADDYVVKPFSPKVLTARIRTAIRRHKSIPENDNGQLLKTGTLSIDSIRHEVKIADELIDLTYTEFCLLHLLASHPGRVYTRNQIIDAVRGSDYAVTERSVDVQVVGLRKKLGSCGNAIETVRGIGYRFRD